MSKFVRIIVGTEMGMNEGFYYEVIYHSTSKDCDDYLATQAVLEWSDPVKSIFSLVEAEELTKRKKLREVYQSVEFVEVAQLDKSLEEVIWTN